MSKNFTVSNYFAAHTQLAQQLNFDSFQKGIDMVQAAFYDGLSHSEIAEAFNLPLGTVKSRIRLAFQRLKGDIEPQI